MTLDGSDSTDAQGQPLTHRWIGPFGALSGPVVSAALPIGLSAVKLEISDGSLRRTATESVRVTVAVSGLESPLGPLVKETDLILPPAVSFEAGRTLPLKLGLACGGQLLTSTDVGPPRLLFPTEPLLGLVPGTMVPIAPVVTSDTGGVFRSGNTNWICNLSKKDLGPGSYELLIEMPDGLRYRSIIALR